MASVHGEKEFVAMISTTCPRCKISQTDEVRKLSHCIPSLAIPLVTRHRIIRVRLRNGRSFLRPPFIILRTFPLFTAFSPSYSSPSFTVSYPGTFKFYFFPPSNNPPNRIPSLAASYMSITSSPTTSSPQAQFQPVVLNSYLVHATAGPVSGEKI